MIAGMAAVVVTVSLYFTFAGKASTSVPNAEQQKALARQAAATGSQVNFRFKCRDPAAKGKPKTNCFDTSDPNRAKADVCGVSWSATVRDP